MTLAAMLAAVVLAILAGLAGWAMIDRWDADNAWAELARTAPAQPGHFDPATVEALPEPARRFLRFAIAPGARLSTVAEIEMEGELGLGSKDAPGYRPMRARQILSAPHGLVWRVVAGTGLARLAGSDGMAGKRSWTRFRLLGLVPVVRAGGDRNHLRASLGRAVAEAAFWTPAALLPGRGVTWEAVDADTARATIAHLGMTQPVDIRVDAEGRPRAVMIPRWTNVNPEGVWRLQPFGGMLDEFREFDGFRLPTRVDGGNWFGTDAYFPFFRARVTGVRWVGGADAGR